MFVFYNEIPGGVLYKKRLKTIAKYPRGTFLHQSFNILLCKWLASIKIEISSHVQFLLDMVSLLNITQAPMLKRE